MKVLSINLWYENYKNKTNAQLSSFRQHGYDTYVASITNSGKTLSVYINLITNSSQKNVYSTQINSTLSLGYKRAFCSIFEYAAKNDFDLIYIRRLMSKLFYAYSSIRNIGKNIPIVYEIPTFPLDTNETFLYRLRDTLEMKLYNRLTPYIALTTAIARDEAFLPNNWLSFHNGIDISNYRITDVPKLTDTIRFIAVANMADWHRYERMLYAMKEYNGRYRLELTVIAPSNATYDNFKEKVKELGLDSSIKCLGKKSLEEIIDLAATHHIGMGQLSYSKDCPPTVNTLKAKDYCAMGLPFFSTCQDTSFEPDYPYAYVIKDMDEMIILDDIIDWYEAISKNPDYKNEMYNYAENNLQFNQYIESILHAIN